ncbi:hypothetical protein [Microbacterium sp.]|uniref:hypothetical protein n=1 Tax=Microbacterium sp. TaxID=51671 RepID=UPI003C744C6B
MVERMPRRAAVLVGLALAGTLVLASACAPTPEPTPSPTGFASEEEAFAAAEETYRAYTDAANARRSDPDSGPAPSDFLTGEALTAELDSEKKFQDAGVHLEGDIVVASANLIEASSSTADLHMCIDVSGTRVVSDTGEDVTPTDRERVQALEVTAVWAPGRPLISSSRASELAC